MTGKELYARFDQLLAECWGWPETDSRVPWEGEEGNICAPLPERTRKAYDRLASELKWSNKSLKEKEK